MIETGRPEALLPLALFMVLMLGVSFFVRWQARTGEGGFLRQYFVGNRDLAYRCIDLFSVYGMHHHLAYHMNVGALIYVCDLGYNGKTDVIAHKLKYRITGFFFTISYAADITA